MHSYFRAKTLNPGKQHAKLLTVTNRDAYVLRENTGTTGHLQIVNLQELISLKLDSWVNSPLRRHKDKTDVIELIIRRQLPRELAVATVVRDLYLETWDGLQAEG